MEKNNTWLKVIIVILCLLVICLTGYILYDKILNNKKDVTNYDKDINVDENNNSLLSTDEALIIVKDLTEKYFTYKYTLGAYCGEANSQDYIYFGSYETNDFRDYKASTSYNSLIELKEYFMSIMTEDLLPNSLNNGISYLEQDGKLYCELSHKGPAEMYNETASYFKIDSIKSNLIRVNVILASNEVASIKRREGIIEIKKNVDNNWVVAKYDVQLI